MPLLSGNDSGPLHLALALQTPSIGLLGADDPHRIGPYQVDWGAFMFNQEACLRNPCLTKRCPQTTVSRGYSAGRSNPAYPGMVGAEIPVDPKERCGLCRKVLLNPPPGNVSAGI